MSFASRQLLPVANAMACSHCPTLLTALLLPFRSSERLLPSLLLDESPDLPYYANDRKLGRVYPQPVAALDRVRCFPVIQLFQTQTVI